MRISRFLALLFGLVLLSGSILNPAFADETDIKLKSLNPVVLDVEGYPETSDAAVAGGAFSGSFRTRLIRVEPAAGSCREFTVMIRQRPWPSRTKSTVALVP